MTIEDPAGPTYQDGAARPDGRAQLVGVALCPHPPLLLPGLTGTTDPVPDLRAACRAAVADLLTRGPEAVVLLGTATATAEWPSTGPSGAARYTAGRAPAAAPCTPKDVPLPLSLAVGQALLDEAGWRGSRRMLAVAADAEVATCLDLGSLLLAGQAPGERVGLLVLGDGSGRRTLKAPGYLDPRAAGYDAQAGAGIRGEPAALAALDPVLGRELLVAGRAAWQVLAGAAATAGPISARVYFADDPFGVAYVVAGWEFTGTPDRVVEGS